MAQYSQRTITSALLICALYSVSAGGTYLSARSGVRKNKHITKEEAKYYKKRAVIAHNAIEKLVGKKIDAGSVPHIGIAASGGGMRAMTATMGMLKGLKKIGFLDATLAISTLSGSTWALAPLIASGEKLNDFSEKLSHNIDKNTLLKTGWKRFWRLIPGAHYVLPGETSRLKRRKKKAGLEYSTIDTYGYVLGKVLMKPFIGDKYRTETMTDLAYKSNYKTHPFPIFTAATRHEELEKYEWLTFTPHTITRFMLANPGTTYSIPTETLYDKVDKHGGSTRHTFEPLLGYCMGVFGSAFSVSLNDFYERKPSAFSRGLDFLTPKWLDKKKIMASEVPNFLRGSRYLNERDDKSTLRDKEISIVDGGYRNNNPVEPLCLHAQKSGYPLDLIIFLDCKQGEEDRVSELARMREECKKAGIRIDDIGEGRDLNKKTSEKHGVTYWPPYKGGPGVIYISLAQSKSYDKKLKTDKEFAAGKIYSKRILEEGFAPRDDSHYETSEFAYSEEEYNALAGLIEYGIIRNHKRGLFMQALTDAFAHKNAAGDAE